MNNNQIIILSGGTGVGTSTFSFELAKTLGISTVISTDWIREILRSIISKDVIPYLDKSTYLAGQTENYHEKNEDVQKSEIIRAFKNQAASINAGIEGVIKRANSENIPIIIEGIHLIPGKLQDMKPSERYATNIIEFFIYIKDEKLHKNRFINRTEKSPERNMIKYIDNFKEIRWIQEYLFQRSCRYDNIIKIENSGDIRTGLDNMLASYFSHRKKN